jgi:hypothetical protein
MLAQWPPSQADWISLAFVSVYGFAGGAGEHDGRLMVNVADEARSGQKEQPSRGVSFAVA